MGSSRKTDTEIDGWIIRQTNKQIEWNDDRYIKVGVPDVL